MNKNLVTAIIKKNHKDVNDIVCRERLIINSVVYNHGQSVILVKGLRKAKGIARKVCKETKCNVIINHHQPWDSWREFISVHYGTKRLRWFYLHVDALVAKRY